MKESIMVSDKLIGRAACLVEIGKPLALIDVVYQLPISEGLVLVKNDFTTICGSQLGEIDGRKGKDPYLPHLLGHESFGRVVEVGHGVKKVKANDQVILHWMKGSGAQIGVPSLNSSIGNINSGPITTFSEYSLISESRCTPVTTNLDGSVLPLFGCSATTAFGSLVNDSKVNAGENLLVLGLGPIGIFTLEMGKLLSLGKVIGVDINRNRVSFANKLGFNSYLDTDTEKSSLSDLIGLNEGEKLHIIDTTGNVDAISRAYEYMKVGDSMILVGVSKQGEKILIDPMPLHYGTKISGSFGGGIYPDRDIPALIKLAEESKFRVDLLGGRIYGLESINQAIDDFRSGDILKAVIKFYPDSNS
jgi:Zn-dependent alcohol dehydrogenase